jgi:hypothetical protein
VLGLLAGGLMVSCSGSSSSGFFADGGGSESHSGTGGGSGTGSSQVTILGASGDAGGSSNTADGDCPASAKLVYVTGEGSTLYSFYPPTFDFKLIGTLSCLGPNYTPTHMTVDRTGTAWVVAWNVNTYVSKLFTASTADATCTEVTAFVPQPTGYFSDFALTFIGTTNAPDTTLYMLGATGGAGGEFKPNSKAVLGTFDTTTGAVTTIAMPDVANAGGDMTTNGDGTLYYLQDTAALELFQILPSNGAIGKTYAPSPTGGGDQALAFWGGSFYLWESGPAGKKDVTYQYDPSTGTTTTLGPAPIPVTGAGQSTCVPTVPPMTK